MKNTFLLSWSVLILFAFRSSAGEAENALMDPIRKRDINAVKAALENGADPNGNFNGRPILALAAGMGQKNVVEAMLAKGADVNIKDKNCGSIKA